MIQNEKEFEVISAIVAGILIFSLLHLLLVSALSCYDVLTLTPPSLIGHIFIILLSMLMLVQAAQNDA